MMRASALLLAAFLIALATTAKAEPDGALLQGLDKITAKTFAFRAPFNRPIRFGSLEVTVRDCVARVRAQAPERTAFLEIVEAKPGQPRSMVFSGWMFASAPSVSAMEHPVYDIWVVGCSGVEGDTLNKSVPELEALQDEEAPDENAPIPED
ncbi:MAG: DUF2155 domain-containing protein [Kiloniellales bacterium]